MNMCFQSTSVEKGGKKQSLLLNQESTERSEGFLLMFALKMKIVQS